MTGMHDLLDVWRIAKVIVEAGTALAILWTLGCIWVMRYR